MTTIYHNPRCSKSRTTLALLEELGISLVVVEYLKTPPGHTEIRKIIEKLRLRPRDIVRKTEAEKAGIDPDLLSAEEMIAAIAAHPEIMERPIVINGDKAVIGRPPENVLAIIK